MTAASRLSLGRKVAYALIPGGLVVLIAFVAGEVYLRRQHRSIAQITGVTEWQTERWKGITYHWDQYHPRFGWTNVPGYQSDASVPFSVCINQQGLRADREYDSTPAPDVARIALLGDSCTFGEEVDGDATISHHLEQRFVGVDALNFGVHGYGLGQMVLRLEDEGFGFHPDHAVFVLLIPLDLARDPVDTFTHPKPRFSVVDGELQIDNVPVPEASRQPWLLRRCYVAAWLFGRPKASAESTEELGAQLEIARALLDRARAACERRGVDLTLVLIVNGGTIDGMTHVASAAQVVAAIRRDLKDAGVDTLDLVDPLVELHQRTQGRQVARFGHWKSDANRLIADHIGRHLAAEDPRVQPR